MNDWWLLAIKVFTCNNELQGHGYNLSIRLLGVIASGSLIQVCLVPSMHQLVRCITKVHQSIAKLCHRNFQDRFLYIHPVGWSIDVTVLPRGPPQSFALVTLSSSHIMPSRNVGCSNFELQNRLKIIWNNDRSVTMQIQPYSKCDILLKSCLSIKKIYKCTACLADLWTVMQEKG